jgi:hypothetical protein
MGQLVIIASLGTADVDGEIVAGGQIGDAARPITRR